ncbi:MAG: EamA family transporter [Thermodesulfobacteriota bacterium]
MNETGIRSSDGGGQVTGYLYLGAALILAAYINLVLKYYLNSVGDIPSGTDFLLFCLKFLFLSFWGLSCIASVVSCALLWFAIISRFELSYIFPFMSLNFVLVTVLSMLILGEPFSWNKIIGVALIVLGVVVVGRGI